MNESLKKLYALLTIKGEQIKKLKSEKLLTDGIVEMPYGAEGINLAKANKVVLIQVVLPALISAKDSSRVLVENGLKPLTINGKKIDDLISDTVVCISRFDLKGLEKAYDILKERIYRVSEEADVKAFELSKIQDEYKDELNGLEEITD